MGLTEKQKRFVDFYCAELNGTKAAVLAGYSRKSASQMGYENLRKPEIKKCIEQKMRESLPSQGVVKARAIKELLDVIVSTPEKSAEVLNQLRAIEILFKNLNLLPEVSVSEEGESKMMKLIQNAKLYEKRAKNGGSQ